MPWVRGGDLVPFQFPAFISSAKVVPGRGLEPRLFPNPGMVDSFIGKTQLETVENINGCCHCRCHRGRSPQETEVTFLLCVFHASEWS